MEAAAMSPPPLWNSTSSHSPEGGQLCDVSPSEGISAVASHLVQCWGESLGVKRCVLRWNSSRTLQHCRDALLWEPGRGIALAENDDPFRGLQEIKLPTGAELPASLGMPAEQPAAALSADALALTARLLDWADEFEQRVESNKLAALAEFAAGAGHEINNPLGSIIGRASSLLKEEQDPERRRVLETIGAQAYRIRDMIGDAMLFARPPRQRLSSLSLAELASEVAGQFQSAAAARGVSVSLTLSEPPLIQADATQLSVALAELVRNALDAVPDQGTIEVCVDQRERRSRQWAVIEVTNNGAPLTDIERKHCFDPFFSGREAGRGLGFGLSKCWRIVNLHQGHVEVRSDADHTSFTIHLPILTAEA